jgi:putative ABC transport system permease protein
MKLSAYFRTAFSTLFRRSRVDRDMDDELRAHIQSRADDLERSGLSRAEAERRARIEFGGYEHFKEECREAVGAHFLENLLQDVRFGFRLLRKSPGFTSVAILTLALGIGANTAIFSVVYAVLLRPLPYTHPEQLVLAFENNLQQGIKIRGCSYQNLIELQHSGIFAQAAGVSRHDLTLTGIGDPALVTTVGVTPEIFSLLNVSPLAGRYLFPDDEIQGAAPVVVLSERLWRTRLGANPHIMGSSITLDQRPFTVVGIMPASFEIPLFGNNQEIWIPVIQDPLFSAWIPKRELHWLRVAGRLNPGVSLERAQSEVDAISRRVASEFPAENGGWAIHLMPLQQAISQDLKTPLLVLLGAAGLVLLLACLNMANLLLARATSRTREVALRQALGARRSRIVRQLLTESAVLGLLGGILGVALAYWCTQALGSFMPPDVLGMQAVQVDGWVLAFALLLSMAANMGFGLGPALLTSKSDVQSNLQDNTARSGSGAGSSRARNFLAAGEIALAVVLVAAAGLMTRSLSKMIAVNPGFDADHVLKAEVSLPRYQYSTPQQWTTFSDALLERLQAQPGLQESAIAIPLPLADAFVKLRFTIANRAALPGGTPTLANYVSVSPEYFHVMGIPLLRGRNFAQSDSPSSPPVTIISEAFAKLYFRHEDPLGKRLMFAFPPAPNTVHEIVGVVADIRDAGLNEEPGPMMYVPFAQAPFWGGELVVKSALPPSTVVETIRRVVRTLDKDLPVTDIAKMPDVLDAAVAEPRFRAWLLSGFGAVALLLAAAGIFGVVSYSVASRTREFGVRAALGASPWSIKKMVLMQGLALGGFGLAAGLVTSVGVLRFLKGELYGVAAYDPATFLTSTVILLGIAVAACYIPARRAMKVDPMVALHYE